MKSKAALLREIRDPERLVGLMRRDPKLLKYLLSDVGFRQKYCKLPEGVEREMKDASGRLGLSEAEFIGLSVVHMLGALRP